MKVGVPRKAGPGRDMAGRGWEGRAQPAEPPTFPRPFPPDFHSGTDREEIPAPPGLLCLFHRLQRADRCLGSAGEEGGAWGAALCLGPPVHAYHHNESAAWGQPSTCPSNPLFIYSGYSRGMQVALPVEEGARGPPSQLRQSDWPSGRQRVLMVPSQVVSALGVIQLCFLSTGQDILDALRQHRLCHLLRHRACPWAQYVPQS